MRALSVFLHIGKQKMKGKVFTSNRLPEALHIFKAVLVGGQKRSSHKRERESQTSQMM